MINVKLLKSNPTQKHYRKKNKNQNDISTDNKNIWESGIRKTEKNYKVLFQNKLEYIKKNTKYKKTVKIIKNLRQKIQELEVTEKSF